MSERIESFARLPIDLPLPEIVALCRAHHVRELGLFGSVLRGDFGPSSDVDFLARFEGDDAGPWMSRLTGLQEDLERILKRPVDVLDWNAIEKSRNPFRRHAILSENKTLYVA